MLREHRYIILILLMVTVATSCTLFNNEKEEFEPEIPGKLVYSAPDGNGKHQIYTSLTNGTKRKQLTQSGSEQAEFFNPSWSKDGTQIVFMTTLRSTSEGLSIYIMNADGSELEPLEYTVGNNMVIVKGNNPVWSPDGSKIAYDLCINCEAFGSNIEIFSYNIGTQTNEQITNNPAKDDSPSWSPDSKDIIFSSGRDYFNEDTLRFRTDLYKVTLDKIESRITENGNATNPEWSPVPKTVIY